MRRHITMLITVCLVVLAGNALAEDIGNRFGLTGKLGFVVPLQGSQINGAPFWLSESGFAAGGGLIFGIGKYIAAEVDITHVPKMDVIMGPGGRKVADATVTDVGLGVQYRILPEKKYVPYIGGGADFIKGNIQNTSLEWTYGGHVNGGLDYFVMKGVALNVDCRYLFGRRSDITMNGVNVGKFDPNNITTTFGVRLFLPEKWWN